MSVHHIFFLNLTYNAPLFFSIVELDGYVIPKGASVITNMVSMHKNPDVYPDRPNEFLPERFMNALETTLAASNGKIEDRDHFNFGWGR